MAYPIEIVPLDSIRFDLADAARAALDETTVGRYGSSLAAGQTPMPATVYRGEDGVNWLSDGGHRGESYRRAGRSEMPCEIRPGGYDAAVLAVAAANNERGPTRSDADKACQVRMLLGHQEYSSWSTKRIAAAARVSWSFADKVRAELEATAGAPATRVARDGRNMQARVTTQDIRRSDKVVTVTVPQDDEPESLPETNDEPVGRESYRIQALLAQCGEKMGFRIWLPKHDRMAVLREWTDHGALVDALPLNYDEPTLRTIEQIDVIWLKGRSIVRAFEVEHTTAIYSGILRMADLLALQPNMDIKLHIVAPASRREKVFGEIQRPVFSLLEKCPLSERCTFLSYDSARTLSQEKHLEHLSDSVLAEYEEEPE